MTKAEIPNGTRAALRRLFITTLMLYFAVVGVGIVALSVSANQRAELEQVATSTNTALCTLRVGLADRIETLEGFLESNPGGSGFVETVLRASIANQQTTVEALGNLKC